MIFYKLFDNGADLFNHIENYHCSIAVMQDNKCPYCGSGKISKFGMGKSGDVSAMGEVEGKEYQIYFCGDCSHLSKSNG